MKLADFRQQVTKAQSPNDYIHSFIHSLKNL